MNYNDHEKEILKKADNHCKGCIFYEDDPGHILGECRRPVKMICRNYEFWK